MRLIYKRILFIAAILTISEFAAAQQPDTPVSVDPALQEIFSSKFPKEYTIAGITVGGTKAFDENLIISISGLAVGDKVQIPGTDVFAKAIAKLWKQSLISKIDIYFTKLEGRDLYVHLELVERPRLGALKFEGIKKGEKDDLETKVPLVKERVVTENMKLSAVEAIRKFYYDKGFRNAEVTLKEEIMPNLNNAESITFFIKKGNKVRVNSVNFSGNESVAEQKLKKQMKGTKEMTRVTLYPVTVPNPFGDSTRKKSFKEYINDVGFLSLTKTRDILDPYFRFKMFSSAKFNEKKYGEDKEKVLDYLNSQGFRDAVIAGDTSIYDPKGNINVFLKINEGRKYYFGDITWRGNTKYTDSILTSILAIKKGDVYNLELLNKRLGKQMSIGRRGYPKPVHG